MTARDILDRIRQLGGSVVGEGGAHTKVRCACGRWRTVVPRHKGRDIPAGTLGAIRRHLAPCASFGKRWT